MMFKIGADLILTLWEEYTTSLVSKQDAK